MEWYLYVTRSPQDSVTQETRGHATADASRLARLGARPAGRESTLGTMLDRTLLEKTLRVEHLVENL